MSKKITLSCEICGSRNYSVPAGNTAGGERMNIKKFCKHCNAHTLHKQTI